MKASAFSCEMSVSQNKEIIFYPCDLFPVC